jgi:hypothetical protein
MTNFERSAKVALVAALLSFAPGRAVAQSRDPAAAQALFDEAKKLSSAGRYAEACEKLAESNRLDPGIGTQFHLADCQEKSGKIASAWANFLEVASLARASGQSDREKAALARAAKLESRLPRVQVDVPEASRVSGLEVRRDGLAVGSAQWGTPVPADPGEHDIVATAPGKLPFAKKIKIELGKTAKLEIPLLETDPTPGAEPAGAAAAAASTTAPPAATEPASSSTPPTSDRGTDEGGPNPLVYALAGVGVVGIGVGTVFGLMASSKNEDSKGECRENDPNRCTQAGVELRDEALANGNVATVAFIVGGAALAGAGIWFLVDSGGAEKSSAARRREVPEGGLSAGVGPTRGGAALYLRGGF